jgi:hypothetical protein
MTDLLDPQFEWVQPVDAVEPGMLKGIAEARAGVAKIREIFPDMRVAPERYVEVGDEVLVVYRAPLEAAAVDHHGATGGSGDRRSAFINGVVRRRPTRTSASATPRSCRSAPHECFATLRSLGPTPRTRTTKQDGASRRSSSRPIVAAGGPPG